MFNKKVKIGDWEAIINPTEETMENNVKKCDLVVFFDSIDHEDILTFIKGLVTCDTGVDISHIHLYIEDGQTAFGLKNINGVEDYLKSIADGLEPQSHCCECEAGILHCVHIQYPECKCFSDNEEERKKWLGSLN